MEKARKIFNVCLILIVCIFGFAACNKGDGKMTYWQEKVAIFKEENKTFEENQIVFIGDSITDYYDLDLFFDLPLKTYNRGIGGDTTAGVLNRMCVSLFNISPSKIVINIGTNDLNGERTVEEILLNYQNILSQIKNKLPNCEVYVQSIYPVNDNPHNLAWRTPYIMEINSNLQTMATSLSYEFIDVFSSLKVQDNTLNPSYADDGLHPNVAGYEVITSVILPYLI